MLRYRGLAVALVGFLAATLGYVGAPVLGDRLAVWLVLAGMACCGVGFIIHLLMLRNTRRRR